MGTAQSHAAAEREWKGPFSDEEYECLVTKYKEISAAVTTPASQHVQLQKLLELPAIDQLPTEWRAGISQLGVAFVDICMHARVLNGSDDASTTLKLTDFVQGVAQCTRGSSQSVTRTLLRMFMKDKTSAYLDETSLHQLLAACLVMADERLLDQEPSELVHVTKKLAQAALPIAPGGASQAQLSIDEMLRWTNAQAPLLYSVFTSWMAKRMFGKIARPAYTCPVLSARSDILSRSQSIALSFTCTPLQGKVDRLYTSTQDGLSFNRLCHHILGYGGPTLVVIRNTDGDIFGMYCDTEWRETTKFYGSNACFLFRVDPHVSIFRVSANENTNYMYLNTKGVALPRGLGMGGDVNGFRLFLNEDLDENCYTAPKCLSFEPGRLTTKNKFTVEALEVWGCGGEDSAQRQREYRNDTADMINKMRKVDKAAFAGNEFDRSFFLGKTFGHGTDQARIADDEH